MPVFTLSVEGSATIPYPAERANVSLSARNTGANKQAVADIVLTTAEHVDAHIRDIQDKFHEPNSDNGDKTPIAHHSKTSLTTTSELLRPYNNSSAPAHDKDAEAKREFTAEIQFDIRFRNFAALGEFSARLAALDHCEIRQIQWRLLPATQDSFDSRLRKQAAADALLRAKDLCSVLCSDDEVLRIIPVKLDNMDSGSGYTNRRFMYAQELPPPSKGTFSFTPQECVMNLHLEMTFNVETKGIEMQLEKAP